MLAIKKLLVWVRTPDLHTLSRTPGALQAIPLDTPPNKLLGASPPPMPIGGLALKNKLT